MATRVLSVIRLSLFCAAFSWPRQISVAKSGTARYPTSAEDELVGLLANHAALEDYSRRPDCFRRVAGSIHVRCGELEMNEDERVQAAISMTLCELATATHHSIPLECASFTVGSVASRSRIQGECVDALSRSAQFWSSYSGYLREVPQLCFAFRRWNDIDTAKDIYKNSTQETMKLIQLLLARETAGKKHWDMHLHDLEAAAMRLKTMSNTIDVVIGAAAPRLENSLKMIIDVFMAALTQNVEVENTRIIDRMGFEFELISQRHAHSLNGILETSLVDNLNNALSPLQMQSLQAFNLANSAQDLWMNLTLQFNVMHQKISQLSEDVFSTAATLESSSNLVQDAQIAASLAASSLAETLTQLNTTTHESFEKLNASLSQSLSPRRSVPGLIWLFEAVLRLDPSTITYLHHLPLFPLASALASLVFYLLHSTCSGLMSLALLFLSSRKYLTNNQSLEAAHAPLPTPRTPELMLRRKSRIPDRLCSRL
ncbi:hypothetical protein B0H15DRAFT_864983 [Mycena belliarum]|uniref:Nuclear fusion protein KAR5 n=1 Tax=Mycena belliarum TaxID=1033014 RepID=A0AAD6TS88_9AGAR|nr:hypothetical protein B0H15DRAFT_864983 [Mycena belliae]